MINKSIIIVLSILFSQTINAQELLEILEKEQPKTINYTASTFMYSRITYGHSVETRKNGTLDVQANSRFWNTPAIRTQSFFVDRMSTRFALEYGISNRFMFGVGATTFDGKFDSFLKYKLVRQSDEKSPVTISLFQNASYYSRELLNDVSNRFSYTSQILIAKRINQNLSFQIAPTFINRGIVYDENDTQNHFAVGIGGRYKLGKHVSFASEYYHIVNPIESVTTYGPFSLGVNWELSDVMLQFMLTNAVNKVEDAFITDTRNNFNFKNPNLNFGFNFTYTIHFKNGLKKLNNK